MTDYLDSIDIYDDVIAQCSSRRVCLKLGVFMCCAQDGVPKITLPYVIPMGVTKKVVTQEIYQKIFLNFIEE